ncbi:MAG: hypothetical protein JEZ05_01770 [Tenericutes bacterium]|nr:hypothetical protein [Mycoplasmatota bacterium]
MKKIILVLALMFSLVACDEETTTTMTYPEMSYLSFSAYWITDVDEQLTQDESVYYLYFYGSNCVACQTIKDEALYTIEFLDVDAVYFVQADSFSAINAAITIEGTPSLVKIVNGEVDEVFTGGTSVLAALHGLD